MGSPLGPLMANAFLCSIEEKLEQDNKLPEFYRRYVDDTFATMKNIPAAADFLSTLNGCHPSINFTMDWSWHPKANYHILVWKCSRGAAD